MFPLQLIVSLFFCLSPLHSSIKTFSIMTFFNFQNLYTTVIGRYSKIWEFLRKDKLVEFYRHCWFDNGRVSEWCELHGKSYIAISEATWTEFSKVATRRSCACWHVFKIKIWEKFLCAKLLHRVHRRYACLPTQ